MVFPRGRAGIAGPTLVIDGDAITSIASFYDEINRVFMAAEDWCLGLSLDALDDLLHGGYGALRGGGPATVVWRDMEKSRAALGIEATRAFLRAKLEQPARFDAAAIARQLAALENDGATYFATILAIFADHPRITLVPA